MSSFLHSRLTKVTGFRLVFVTKLHLLVMETCSGVSSSCGYAEGVDILSDKDRRENEQDGGESASTNQDTSQDRQVNLIT